jgi:hypothetical protein
MERLQERAVAALLDRPTVSEAAAAVGIDESTLGVWLRDSAFQAAYAVARREILERTVARLLAVTGEAVEALRRNLGCGKPAAEIRAATAILDHAARGVEAVDLAEQIAAIKKQLEGLRGDRHQA